ncbi:hypothetical protein GR140_32010 (plasmid) [Pseudomonas putida]|uniref:hypothetical protein n=1 Tax=Pseudomonas putida TaxID=303 RepID=UPI001BB02739|nr:hypothetical protein [Pseudomonas putida]QUG93366.1 hypothetical protein GR140_32010 [Pseudomonas putida]
MLRSIAALGRSLKPGLIVLGGTLVIYGALRALLSETALAPPLVYSIGLLLSIVLLIKGVGAWVEGLRRTIDSPQVRARFVQYLDQLSTGAISKPTAEFTAKAQRMKGQVLPAAAGGCWYFDLSVKDFPYQISGYFMLGDQQLSIALVGGVEGGWQETRYLLAPCELEGSTLTVISSFGGLEWLPPGSQVIVEVKGEDVAELASMALNARMSRAPVPEALKRFVSPKQGG